MRGGKAVPGEIDGDRRSAKRGAAGVPARALRREPGGDPGIAARGEQLPQGGAGAAIAAGAPAERTGSIGATLEEGGDGADIAAHRPGTEIGPIVAQRVQPGAGGVQIAQDLEQRGDGGIIGPGGITCLAARRRVTCAKGIGAGHAVLPEEQPQSPDSPQN